MKAYPFLHKHPTSGQTTMSEGMDLRDYFAAQAISFVEWHKYNNVLCAKKCYEIADAMMKQREVKDEQH